MALHERLYTVEEYWEIAQHPENVQKRLELINGAIVEMPPSSVTNAIIEMWLGYLLIGYVLPKGLGHVTGSDAGYMLGPNTLRQPDVAYISKARGGPISAKVFPVGPDLAIEVISPSESATEINEKVNLYFQGGTRQVWLVYPLTRTVHVYNAATQVQIVGVGQEIDAESAIPGFTLKVVDIFSVLES